MDCLFRFGQDVSIWQPCYFGHRRVEKTSCRTAKKQITQLYIAPLRERKELFRVLMPHKVNAEKEKIRMKKQPAKEHIKIFYLPHLQPFDSETIANAVLIWPV